MQVRKSTFLIPMITGCVVLAAFGSPAHGQGSGSSRIGQPGTGQASPSYRQPYAPPAQARPQTTEEFAQSLWAFLVRPQSPYTQWPPLPSKDGWRTAAEHHGPSVRLYANTAALADPKGLPPGSIVILEDYSADQKSRTGINILYRVKGFDPKNGDWYWMKYLENGTLVREQSGNVSVPVAGRVMACIDCHRKAAGNDFVFSNDPAAAPVKQPEKKAEEKKKADEKKGDEKVPGKPGVKLEVKKAEHTGAGSGGLQILLGRDWPPSERVSIDAIDHQAWDALLKNHVDQAGQVDYAAWKASREGVRGLEGYLNALARADATQPAARASRLAYWINAYNALTVWAILRDYSTVRNPDQSAAGTLSDALADIRLRVGSASFAIGQIEDEILRKLDEPRIHFAIVCGARGCPRLLNEGYTAAELEGQLTRNARAFFADLTKFNYDPSRNQVQLSPIIDWYGEDFGKDTAERLRRIAPYLPEEAARRLSTSGATNVTFLDYDSGLNDRSTPQDGKSSQRSEGHER